jgi:hypothetical protein
MRNSSIRTAGHRGGSALIIVLAFLLLLTALAVAMLSRATLERQLSNASFNQGKVDLAGQGAIATIIGDLQQEIVAGSHTGTATLTLPAMASGYYYPNAPATMVPYTNAITHAVPPLTDGLENLLKISKSGVAFYGGANYSTTPTIPNRASSINSFNSPSINNRIIKIARWNLPLLMQPVNVGTTVTDFTPPASFVASPPDWIYVARDGSNPTTWSTSFEYLPSVPPTGATGPTAGTNPVTQRYAYTIYNEGGTLDMNVAGSPIVNSPSAGTYSAYQPYKSALAYADLTQLPPISTLSLNAGQKAAFIDAIVGWRNYASSGLANLNVYPNGYKVTTTVSSSFDQFVSFNPNAFLQVGGNSVYSTPGAGNLDQTDNAFSSRRHLLQFLIQGLGHNSTFLTNTGLTLPNLETLLPYLGTFSRGLSQPSYAPAPLGSNAPSSTGRPPVLPLANGGNSALAQDDAINPSFLNVVIKQASTASPPPANAPTNASFLRNDNSWAIIGEPLVKKRFALSRLAWVTYKGPSATRTMADVDMAAMTSAGIPKTYLLEGTAGNIQKYFGLEWDATNNRWLYDYHNSAGVPASTSKGPIMKLSDINVAANIREPDFFELLKAGIAVGSLGKALTTGTTTAGNAMQASATTAPTDLPASATFPPDFYYPSEVSTDVQIIQIGANIIDQYQTAGYPIRIAFDNGGLPNAAAGGTHFLREYVSVENYPYFYGVQTGIIPAVDPVDLLTIIPLYDGMGVVTQFPILWNPHDPNSSLGALVSGSGSTAVYLCPNKFRILADEIDPDSLLTTPRQAVTKNLMCWASDQAGALPSNSGSAKVSLDGWAFFDFTTQPFGQGIDPSGADSNYKLTSAITTTAGANTSNSEIDLTITGNGKTMFREPTIIMNSGGGGSNFTFGTGGSTYTASLFAIPSDLSINSVNQVLGIPVTTPAGVYCTVKSPSDTPSSSPSESPLTNESLGQRYLGFYLGAFPINWVKSGFFGPIIFGGPGNIATVTNPLTVGGTVEGTYITYRMQYFDPNITAAGVSPWVTYDTKYGAPLGAGNHPLYWAGSSESFSFFSLNPNAGVDFDPYIRDDYTSAVVDPRTPRFGMFSHYSSPNGYPYNYGSAATTAGSILLGPEWSASTTKESWWLDTTNNTMSTFRMDGSAGNWFHGPYLPSGTAGQTTGWNLPWSNTATTSSMFYPGLLEQNCTQLQLDGSRFLGDAQIQGYAGSSVYYADPDGVVRRADGGYVPPGASGSPAANGTHFGSADTTMGLPMTKMTAVGTGITGVPNLPTISTGLSSAYVVGSNLSTQTVPTQNVSRPYILHRPFRSVAEMGYAFRGTPWKSVNFSMPESGDSALLDIFTLNETNVSSGLEAGKIDLNTRQAPVLAALLANAYLDDPEAQASSTAQTSVLGSAAASAIANGIVKRTTDTAAADIANGAGPFQNISELVGKWSNKALSISAIAHPSGVTPSGGLDNTKGFIDGMLAYVGFSGTSTPTLSSTYAGNTTYPNLMSLYTANSTAGTFGTFPTVTTHAGLPEAMAYAKRYHEAPIRALVNGTQTRVWNLMIDVIAQTGRFPSNAGAATTPLAAFLVEGERRYWVHVAIDRYTGSVIDEQVEEVKE